MQNFVQMPESGAARHVVMDSARKFEYCQLNVTSKQLMDCAHLEPQMKSCREVKET